MGIVCDKTGLLCQEVSILVDSLFLKGLITYPGSKKSDFYKTLDFEKIIFDLTENDKIGEYKPPNMSDFDLDDPECVQRLGFNNPATIFPLKKGENLSTFEQHVFNHIVKYLISSMLGDAEGEETTTILKLGDHHFQRTDFELTKPGFYKILPYDWKAETTLQSLEIGEEVTINSLTLETVESSPPQMFDELALIQSLKKFKFSDFPSLYKAILECQETGLLNKNSSNGILETSNLGLAMFRAFFTIKIVDIFSPNFRKQFEKELDEVSHGNLEKDDFLKNYNAIYAKKLEYLQNGQKHLVNCFKYYEIFPDDNILKPGTEWNSNSKALDKLTKKKRDRLKATKTDFCPRCDFKGLLSYEANENGFLVLRCPKCELDHQAGEILACDIDKVSVVYNFQCPLDNFPVLQYKKVDGQKESYEYIAPHSYNWDIEDIGKGQYEYSERKNKMKCIDCTVRNCQYSDKTQYPVLDCIDCGHFYTIIGTKKDYFNYLNCKGRVKGYGGRERDCRGYYKRNEGVERCKFPALDIFCQNTAMCIQLNSRKLIFIYDVEEMPEEIKDRADVETPTEVLMCVLCDPYLIESGQALVPDKNMNKTYDQEVAKRKNEKKKRDFNKLQKKAKPNKKKK